jgi:predicted signal transduction protein with EAL and GGDEF domain
VAEGVETEEVWNTLTSLGCTIAQGYYLSRPAPPDELRDWLQGRPSAVAIVPVLRVAPPQDTETAEHAA